MQKLYTERLPVFCDDCPQLALADYDGMRLCSQCLMKKIGLRDVNEPAVLEEIVKKISPIDLCTIQRLAS